MSLSDTEVADTSENTQDVDYFVDEYDDNSEEYANIDLELENISNVLEDADRVNTEIQEKAENTKSDAKEALAEQEKNEQERNERDARSVFVRNVHWDATAEEIALFFAPCGPVESCKILMDHNHRPKGLAYVEFCDKASVPNALILSGTNFRDRVITVTEKRTNLPPFMLRGRGRGGPMRGRGASGMSPYDFSPQVAMQFMQAFLNSGNRGRGRGYGYSRGRGRGRGRGGGHGGHGGGDLPPGSPSQTH